LLSIINLIIIKNIWHQSNEAVQDVASIYNNSGTLTVPNLVVTGNVTVNGSTTLQSTTANNLTAQNINATKGMTTPTITSNNGIVVQNYTLGVDNEGSFNITNTSQGNYFAFQSDANFCEYWNGHGNGAYCTMWFH